MRGVLQGYAARSAEQRFGGEYDCGGSAEKILCENKRGGTDVGFYIDCNRAQCVRQNANRCMYFFTSHG